MSKNLNIIFTSDTHGHVFPVNYGTGAREKGGLLCLAKRIQGLHEAPDFDGQTRENTLVIDGGDSLQGTPLTSYYIGHSDDYSIHPVAEAFNAMGCDFFTLGNHDFNFGYDQIRSYLDAMNGQCVCANVEDRKGELKIKPYVIHTMADGLRVGITGAVTDWVNIWEKAENLELLKVNEPLEALRNALDAMRGQCDVSVVIYHGGFEEDLTTGTALSDTTENIACKIMRELDFDLLLTGHQHMSVAGYELAGTHAVQPMDKCGTYCAVSVTVGDENIAQASQGNVSITSKICVSGEVEEQEAAARIQVVENDTQKWLDETMGELVEEIAPEQKLEVALHGSRVANLFNQVQLETTGAEFSCAALMNDPLGFKKEITMRDICAIYQFANTIMVLEVTKQTIKESLERVASYFDVEDGKPIISKLFLQPKVEHYNYDFWANLDYAFDITKPVGERVVRMRKLDGTELEDGKTYTLVTNNYRATGTGGYPAIGASKVLKSTTDEMPDLIADFIRTHTPVPEYHNSKIEVIY